MDYVIDKPVYQGKRIKEYGLVIRIDENDKCSDEERDYMRTKYLCKLIEWKQKELEENHASKSD